MSQPTKEGIVTKLYNVFANMSPKTIDLLLEALERARQVEAETEAALAKDRQSMEGPVEKSDSEQNIDYAIDILDQMKLTPLKKGGSRKCSINCRRPRGFSQRQHCKYGRRGATTTTRRRRLCH